ncbi:acyl-CoA dehydrogenase family protein [Candidatus Bipolaricaulota bacterium]|nr:acyl-CoA dehydrogenase family protein [Candidatus Bipolaricaulota bacterium]
MDFTITKEQEELKAVVREFADKHVFPRVVEFEANQEIPPEIVKEMARLGLFGVVFPEEYEGLGLDPITAGLVLEELVRGDPECSLAVAFLVHTSWGHIACKYGSEELKEDVIKRAARGDLWIGIATTEPGAGSDLTGISVTAKKEGEGYVLTGEKAYISGVKEAKEKGTWFKDGGGHVTLAYTDKTKGHRGMTLFFIPLTDPGITVRLEKEFGRKGWSFGSFTINEVKVPEFYRIGDEGKGFYIAMEGFDHARAYIALTCAVAGKRALEIAAEYTKQRRAFGQPIAKFQGVQFQLAEHWSRLEAAHALAYKALWALKMEQEGKLNRFEVTKIAASAKLFAVEAAKAALDGAMRWMGAFAYTEENPVALAWKAVKSYDWAEGSLDIMRLIVAREVLGKEYIG